MDMGSDSSSMTSMTMVFTNSHYTSLFSDSWTPQNSGQYAGACIFLIVLAVILRILGATKGHLRQKWSAAARNRRYIGGKGQETEAQRIERDPDLKMAALIKPQGIEEDVRVTKARPVEGNPFRLSMDIPRAALVTVIEGVAYLLMLAVMTMNVGYFLSVLGGAFLRELLLGRYTVHGEFH